ncbi:MAG TPA: type III-B CRISPR module RAMP protein Cmr1 [Bacilli bacterium]|nr:type III-B CRISPR module RAMP protein Cmr1 [Bacilli bacterium]
MEEFFIRISSTTPMNVGGANPRSSNPPTLPSIKGALRFWYRVILGTRFQGNLSCVSRRESLLFGSTEHQSPIHLSFQHGRSRRNEFTLHVRIIPELIAKELPRMEMSKDDIRQEFAKALWMWSHFGGLGKGTRRGKGSIQVIADGGLFPSDWKLQTESPTVTGLVSFYQTVLAKILSTDTKPSSQLGPLPPFTYFCPHSRLFLQEVENEKVGAKQMLTDQKLSKSPLYFQPKEKAFFSLPQKGFGKETLQGQARHSSPLLISIKKFGNKTVLTYLLLPNRIKSLEPPTPSGQESLQQHILSTYHKFCNRYLLDLKQAKEVKLHV